MGGAECFFKASKDQVLSEACRRGIEEKVRSDAEKLISQLAIPEKRKRLHWAELLMEGREKEVEAILHRSYGAKVATGSGIRRQGSGVRGQGLRW